MNAISKTFVRIGARANIYESGGTAPLRLDVRNDRRGEYFDIRHAPGVELQVLDVQRELRHLLLFTHQAGAKHKFLCGHDERHWFVAAVPEGRGAGVSTVATAMEALKPDRVLAAQEQQRLGARRRNRRRNAAFVRQGEWFFVPVDPARARLVDERMILYNEPLRRSGVNKPHQCEQLVRQPGAPMMVCRAYPYGLEMADYQHLLRRQPEAAKWGWSVTTRVSSVLVRGRVRHADHATIVLHGWHQVQLNTEGLAPGQSLVTFLD